jgi:hypothetical protein
MSPSANNRIVVVCGAGKYQFATEFTMDTQFIDLVSLTGNRDVKLFSDESLGIMVMADNVFIKGVDVGAKSFFQDLDTNFIICENCKGGDGSFGGGTTDATCTYINCEGGVGSFNRYQRAAGTYINCKGGGESFGCYTQATGTFINCEGGVHSFGAFDVASGTFINCVGGEYSFGGGYDDSGAVASGTFDNCKGGDNSFGGGYGTASGIFTNCVGGLNSFAGIAGVGDLTGKLYYCRLTAGTFRTPTAPGLIRASIDGNNVFYSEINP